MEATKFLKKYEPEKSATEFLGKYQPKGVDRTFAKMPTGAERYFGPRIEIPEPGLEEPWVPNPFEMLAGITGAGIKMGLPVAVAMIR